MAGLLNFYTLTHTHSERERLTWWAFLCLVLKGSLWNVLSCRRTLFMWVGNMEDT